MSNNFDIKQIKIETPLCPISPCCLCYILPDTVYLSDKVKKSEINETLTMKLRNPGYKGTCHKE